MNINIQQVLFFFLKKPRPKKQKNHLHSLFDNHAYENDAINF